MKKLLVLMLAMLTAVTCPEQFKMNSICVALQKNKKQIENRTEK